eukprot:TRINITY_DN7051_c0_g1_i1.p1 TRINITY_DN7051_c0_g1~~TRINITY_DN7051_c0_g1_i1.p1  ORF type:complete len:3909 (+),score=551.86 TRINITY_DN7051_c0_g1_i1:1737-11729(+)
MEVIFDATEVGFLLKVAKGNLLLPALASDKGEVEAVQNIFSEILQEPISVIATAPVQGEDITLNLIVDELGVFVGYQGGRFGLGLKGLHFDLEAKGGDLDISATLHQIFMGDEPSGGSRRNFITSSEALDLIKMDLQIRSDGVTDPEIEIGCDVEEISIGLEKESLTKLLSVFSESLSLVTSSVSKMPVQAPPRVSSLAPRELRLPEKQGALTAREPISISEPSMTKPNLKLRLAAKKISVGLQEDLLPFFILSVTGISVSLVTTADGALSLGGAISGLEGQVMDGEWSETGVWNKIISVTPGKQLVDFNLKQFPNTEQFEGASLLVVDAHLASIKIVVIQSSMMRIASYFLNLSSIPIDVPNAPVDSSPSPSLPILKLDVKMESPLIHVPSGPKALGYIGVDFGQLSIHNTFYSSDDPQTLSNNIILGVQKLSLTTNIESHGSELATTRLLYLEGLSLGLFVPQNLSGQSTSKQGAISGSMGVPKVNLSVKFDQLAFLARVVSDNILAAGFAVPVSPQKPIDPSSNSTRSGDIPVALKFTIGEVEIGVDHATEGRIVMYTSEISSSLHIDGTTNVSVSMSSFGLRDESPTLTRDIIRTESQCKALDLVLAEAGSLECNVKLGVFSFIIDSAVVVRLIGTGTRVLELLPASQTETTLVPSVANTLPTSTIQGDGIVDVKEPQGMGRPAVNLKLSCQEINVLLRAAGQDILSVALGGISLNMFTWQTEVLQLSGSLRSLRCRIEGDSEWKHSQTWSDLLSTQSTNTNFADFSFNNYPNFESSGAALSVVKAKVSTLQVCLVCKPLFSVLESFRKISDEIMGSLAAIPQFASKPEQTPTAADFLKLDVSIGVSVVIPESPRSVANVTAGIRQVSVTNFFRSDSGVISNIITIGANDLVLAASYKTEATGNFAYQQLLELSLVEVQLAIPAGKSNSSRPDLVGNVHIGSVRVVLPPDIFSAIVQIYSSNISDLVEKTLELAAAPKIDAKEVAPPVGSSTSFEFSMSELFVGILHSRGTLGCGFRTLTCKLSTSGTNVDVNAKIHTIFIQHDTSQASSELIWPPPEAFSSVQKTVFGCTLHDIGLALKLADKDMDMNASLGNITMDYTEDQNSTTILTMHDAAEAFAGPSFRSKITASVIMRSDSSLPSGVSTACVVDFKNLGFEFTVDRIIAGKLAMTGLELISFTKKVAGSVLSTIVQPVEKDDVVHIKHDSSQPWDLQEPVPSSAPSVSVKVSLSKGCTLVFTETKKPVLVVALNPLDLSLLLWDSGTTHIDVAVGRLLVTIEKEEYVNKWSTGKTLFQSKGDKCASLKIRSHTSGVKGFPGYSLNVIEGKIEALEGVAIVPVSVFLGQYFMELIDIMKLSAVKSPNGVKAISEAIEEAQKVQKHPSLTLLRLETGSVSMVIPRMGVRTEGKGSVLLSIAGASVTNGIHSQSQQGCVINRMKVTVRGVAILIDHKSELLLPEEYRPLLKLDEIVVSLDLAIENNDAHQLPEMVGEVNLGQMKAQLNDRQLLFVFDIARENLLLPLPKDSRQDLAQFCLAHSLDASLASKPIMEPLEPVGIWLRTQVSVRLGKAILQLLDVPDPSAPQNVPMTRRRVPGMTRGSKEVREMLSRMSEDSDASMSGSSASTLRDSSERSLPPSRPSSRILSPVPQRPSPTVPRHKRPVIVELILQNTEILIKQDNRDFTHATITIKDVESRDRTNFPIMNFPKNNLDVLKMEFKDETSKSVSVKIQQPKILPSLDLLSSSFNFYVRIAKEVDAMVAELTKLAGEATQKMDTQDTVFVDLEMVSPKIVLLWDFNSPEPEALIFNLGNLKLVAPAQRSRAVAETSLVGVSSEVRRTEFRKEKLKFKLDIEDMNFFSCKINTQGKEIEKSFILEKAHITVAMVDTSYSNMLSIDTNNRALGINVATRDITFLSHFYYGWELLFASVIDFMYARVQDAVAKADALAEKKRLEPQIRPSRPQRAHSMAALPPRPTSDFQKPDLVLYLYLCAVTLNVSDDTTFSGVCVPMFKVQVMPVTMEMCTFPTSATISILLEAVSIRSWNKKEEDWDHFLEQTSFQISQESTNTHTQTPDNAVKISTKGDGIYVNLCASVLTSALFLGTDFLTQLAPPVPESEKSPMVGSPKYKGTKHIAALTKAASSNEISPIVVTNEYGRTVKVWWKLESPDSALYIAADETKHIMPRVLPPEVPAHKKRDFHSLCFQIVTGPEEVTPDVMSNIVWDVPKTHKFIGASGFARDKVRIDVKRGKAYHQQLIVIRSDTQIWNHTKLPMKVRIIGHSSGTPPSYCGRRELIIEPESRKGVPVDLCDIDNCNLYFLPKGSKHWGVWNGASNEYLEIPEDNGKKSFFVMKRNILDPGIIELRHALVIFNCFAMPIEYQSWGDSSRGQVEVIEEASKLQCSPVVVEGLSVSFRIPGLGTEWSKLINIRGLDTRKDTDVILPLPDGGKITINILRKRGRDDKCLRLVVFCKNWVINHTGLPLQFSDSSLIKTRRFLPGSHTYKIDFSQPPSKWHESFFVDPKFKNTVYCGSNQILVGANGNWSEPFPNNMSILKVPMGTDFSLQLKTSTESGPGPFYRSSIIRIFPAFFIVNDTDVPFYGYFYQNRIFEIPPRSQFQYHYTTAYFKFPNDNDWVGPLTFDDSLKPGPKDVGNRGRRVEIVVVNGIKYIIFREDAWFEQLQLTKADTTHFGTKLEISLPRLCFSLIDNTPQELIYGEATELNVTLAMSVQSLNATISLKQLSVDNQILCNRKNQIIPKTPDGYGFLKLELHTTMTRACVHYRYLDLQLYPKLTETLGSNNALHPLIVTVDHSLLLYIYSYIGWMFRHSPTAHKPVQALMDGECPTWLDGKPQNEIVETAAFIYTEKIHIHQIAVDVTYYANSLLIHKLKARDANILLTNSVVKAVGDGVFGSNLTFQAKLPEYQRPQREGFVNPANLLDTMGRHYIENWGEIIAKNILGNANLGSVAKGLEYMSMDEDTRREELTRRQAQEVTSAGEGVRQGLKNLGHGLRAGLKGVVAEPMKGASQDENKVKGGLTGLGRGVIGVFAKPAAGVSELIQKTGEGISATMRGTGDVMRKSFPRYFPNCLVLPHYENQESAAGQAILYNLDNRKYNKSHIFEYYKMVSPCVAVIVSNQAIFVVSQDLSRGGDKYNLITKIPHPMPAGITMPSTAPGTIYIPFFDSVLAQQSYPLYCQTPIVANEVMQKLSELANKGRSNFGIVTLSDQTIRGYLKKKENDTSLRGGTGGFQPHTFATVHKGFLIWGGNLTIELAQSYAFELGGPGEWVVMIKTRNDTRGVPHHFRCRHKNPVEARKWINACLLNGAKPLSIKKD